MGAVTSDLPKHLSNFQLGKAQANPAAKGLVDYSVKGEEEMLFCKFPIPNIGINSKTEKNRVNDSGILC